MLGANLGLLLYGEVSVMPFIDVVEEIEMPTTLINRTSVTVLKDINPSSGLMPTDTGGNDASYNEVLQS